MQKLVGYLVMTWDEVDPPGETRLHMVHSSLDDGLFRRVVLYVRRSSNIAVLGTAEVKLDGTDLPPMFCRLSRFVEPRDFNEVGDTADSKWCLLSNYQEAKALHDEWKADPKYALGVEQGKVPVPTTTGPHKTPCEMYYRNQVDHFLHKIEARWGVRLTGPKPGDRQRKLGARG